MSEDELNCVFCLDNEGRLLRNNKCPCNYVFHITCYEKYDRKNLCPMCRASVPVEYEIIEVKPTPIIISPPITISTITNTRDLTTNYTNLSEGSQNIPNIQLNYRHLVCACLTVIIGTIIIVNIIIALY